MVRSFDDQTGKDVRNFWNRIAHFYAMGSGSDHYSGWITAFCFWDDDEKCLYNDYYIDDRAKHFEAKCTWGERKRCLLCLDDVVYHQIDTQMVPSGYSTVPVTIHEQ